MDRFNRERWKPNRRTRGHGILPSVFGLKEERKVLEGTGRKKMGESLRSRSKWSPPPPPQGALNVLHRATVRVLAGFSVTGLSLFMLISVLGIGRGLYHRHEYRKAQALKREEQGLLIARENQAVAEQAADSQTSQS
ncbi:hypothetical protein FVE85_4048 [Porphyridium purpureum]|uniref:Uncharacterized protein n=1 Tax=Porphyridium purpureum TaxID=35688 RepID=A0A5J4YTI0_PORPP|nr:hypothetical protein FVE85_4048 [Porphyridium purpureum]|eukprot:POR6441..scf229_5